MQLLGEIRMTVWSCSEDINGKKKQNEKIIKKKVGIWGLENNAQRNIYGKRKEFYNGINKQPYIGDGKGFLLCKDCVVYVIQKKEKRRIRNIKN